MKNKKHTENVPKKALCHKTKNIYNNHNCGISAKTDKCTSIPKHVINAYFRFEIYLITVLIRNEN